MISNGDVEAAFIAYLDRWEIAPLKAVLDAAREGQVVIEFSANRAVISAKTHPRRDALAAKLNALRVESGMTHAQVAEATELSVSAILRNMGGQAVTQWPLVALMVRTMGGDPNDFRAAWAAAKEEPLTESRPRTWRHT